MYELRVYATGDVVEEVFGVGADVRLERRPDGTYSLGVGDPADGGRRREFVLRVEGGRVACAEVDPVTGRRPA